MKFKTESPGSLDSRSKVAEGHFSVTANVNKEGKVYSVMASTEGNEVVDAFETDKLALLQFAALPSTDVLSYISEPPSYTEDMVCKIAGQVLDALDYIYWHGKVYLNLEPANILVYSGRSLGRTVQFKLARTLTPLLPKSLRKQMTSLNLMSGILVFFSMFSSPVNFPSREKPLKKPRTTSMEGTKLFMSFFKRKPIKRPTFEQDGIHRWMNPAGYIVFSILEFFLAG